VQGAESGEDPLFTFGILRSLCILGPGSMQIDPISTFTSRAASIARQELIALYSQLSRKIVAESNYLERLGSGVKQMDAERAKNAALFATFHKEIGRR
jgi:hypothetical protein